MWDKLKKEDKKKYKTLITNFASLSEAFSQKVEVNDDKAMNYVAPIVNSKFQETVFQKAFHAVGEDIANTSYDASVVVDEKHKYLVGIKSFGINSGDQKVAQFKKDSQNWTDILHEIKFYADISPDKETANKANRERYQTLALKIAQLRNQRIESSKAQIRGFNSDDVSVDSVYHVLMPTPKGKEPQIFVGETAYLPIDIENLEILGATSVNNPTNFRFTDGRHTYKYTAADSQLYMTFNNKDIVVDTWDVSYIEDPFTIFEQLHLLTDVKEESEVVETVSWVITDKHGKVEESSGFNAFDGGSKLAKKDRVQRIARLMSKYQESLETEERAFVTLYLEEILLKKWTTKDEKVQMKQHRARLLDFAKVSGVEGLAEDIEKLVYRPVSEVYIPLPDSKHFHDERPHFFGVNIGTFEKDTKKLALPKENRTFDLKFLSSGDVIKAYINQEAGKAIQSIEKQDILGEWILRGVFQLKEREILTGEKLEELQMNGIRLTKFKNGEIGIEFIWIDTVNPPQDAIGWVAKK
ncbi:hypothetical protein [Streptococcus acidominimus]|uniref:Uncharacterized protein n=1 Tax=Streptococcus acidominimus TaxID=1326 RepID=A0A1Q8ECM5_STRAI|nr:hypothetical protein [Streptococcus acidominimus]OLF49544.1 hypothetical protein BU200_06825 [Streptococcus acidominimus]SUN07091.1 Uncharacterised protein [Streptococcus acidominimus]